jgi:hypothetical protein
MSQHRESMIPRARGIIKQYANRSDMTWTKKCCEWFDNSLDAGARSIVVAKDRDVLTIADDGRGCCDPRVMIDLGHTREHQDGAPRSGFFGLGGKVAGIRASQQGRVKVESVVDGTVYSVVADWGRMVEQDEFFYERFEPRPARKNQATGTTITIFNCRKFRDLDVLIRELGYLYTDPLAAGATIVLDIDGDRRALEPYAPPPFSDSVEFECEVRGLTIRGGCGVVEEGVTNHYPGWTFHWGPHRVLKRCSEPAGDRTTARLHGHVYLPHAWPSINLTKDDFADEPDDLFEAVGQACERIIEAADRAAVSIELQGFTLQVEEKLNASLTSMRARVKGRRPGSQGKSGAIEPNGNGKAHEHFSKTQPGDKADDASSALEKRLPQLVKVHWDSTIDAPFRVETKGKRKVLADILLNQTNALIGNFHRRNDADGLNAFVLLLLCSKLSIDEGEQRKFGFVDEMELEEMFSIMTSSVSMPTPEGVTP